MDGHPLLDMPMLMTRASFSRALSASLVAAALSLAACGGGTSDAGPGTDPQRGSYSVVVRSGQPSQIPAEGLTLELIAVDDSRCPVDAVCVWEGHGAATLRVSQTGQTAETVKIGLPAAAERQLPGDASYRGWRLSLQVLEPAPRAATPTPLESYRATVMVQRAP